jgi:hypothetical protein
MKRMIAGFTAAAWLLVACAESPQGPDAPDADQVETDDDNGGGLYQP